MKTKLTLAIVCALAAPGCYMDLGGGGSVDSPLEPSPFEPAPFIPAESINDLDISSAQIEGRLGSVSANGEAFVANAYGDSNWANIDIRARGERGVVMNALNIEGGIGNLEVGQTYRSNSRDYDPGGLYFSMIGCSGPEDGVWDYDRTADEIEVSVGDGPEEGTVELFYTATFEDGSASRGSFVMPN